MKQRWVEDRQRWVGDRERWTGRPRWSGVEKQEEQGERGAKQRHVGCPGPAE